MVREVAAALLVMDRMILIAQAKQTHKLIPNKWELPGGKIEPGETPEECLKRELKEEFCIDVEVGEFFGENTHAYENYGTVRLLVYWAYWVRGEFVPQDHQQYRFVEPKNLLDYEFAPADIPLLEKLTSEDSSGLINFA